MDNFSLSQGGSLALASGGLQNGSNAGTIQTTATIPYTIDGVFASRAAINNVSIAYTAPAGPVYGQSPNGSFTGGVGGSTRLYGLYLDAAGAISVEPGPIVNTADLAAGRAPLEFPATIRNRVMFGALRIAVTNGTTFIPGTTALNAAGVTASYLNLMTRPAEPLRS